MTRVIRFFLICGIALTVFFPENLYAQKEDAAVSPIGVLGEISSEERSLLFNRFQTLLSQYYRLISQDQYKKAEEQVYSTLEIEQCTEGYCIRRIQELLQVERMFFLVVTQVDDVLQLSITLAREEDKLVQEAVCEECAIKELYDRMDTMVNTIAAEDLGSDVVVVEAEDSDTMWHISAITLMLGSAIMAMNAASEYDALAEENQDILASDQEATSRSELVSNDETYDANQEKMKSLDSSITLFNGITAIALIWESYLIYSSFFSEDDAPAGSLSSHHWIVPDNVYVIPHTNQSARSRISLSWQW